jgi:hypothetical protein
MPVITLRNAELAYGLHPLLDRANWRSTTASVSA